MVYTKDDLRDKGSENITTPGKNGSKVTTTTYTVNENTGKIEEHVGEPVITPATDTVVKIAAKDKVTYKKQGDDDVVKTTTVYTVNPKDGNITESSTDEVTQHKGVKDKVVTEDIEPKVVYEKDDLLAKPAVHHDTNVGANKELPFTGSSTADVYALLALASATLLMAKRKQND